MNFIAFIFSLLLIFSFGSLVILEKQAGNRRLRATYLGHIAANRKILSRCESETYQNYRSIAATTEKPKKEKEEETILTHKKPDPNPSCACFNVWPLIQEGKEAHPFLYETVVKVLKMHYGALFSEKPQGEIQFLDAFLKQARKEIQKDGLSLEKIHFPQPIYYRMLKGSKKWDYEKNMGFPPLSDLLKAEPTPSKICLNHAHPGQMAVLFGTKAASHLYDEIHKETFEKLSKEWIEDKCSEVHAPIFNPDVFELIETKNSAHKASKKSTYLGEDEISHVSLRKNIFKL